MITPELKAKLDSIKERLDPIKTALDEANQRHDIGGYLFLLRQY